MSLPVNIVVGNLPAGYCFTTPQQLLNDFASQLTLTVAGNFNGVIIQADIPDAAYNSYLWLRITSANMPIMPFLFGGGQWVWPHPDAPSSGLRKIWAGPNDGTPTGLWTLDGGDGTDPIATPPTATSGSFWQVDTAFEFRLPMGAGTNGTTSYDGNPATALAQGGTAGEERHVLSLPEMWHAHGLGKVQFNSVSAGFRQLILETGGTINALAGTVSSSWAYDGGGESNTPGATSDVNGTSGTIVRTDAPIVPAATNSLYATDGTNPASHQNLPPVLGVYFIKRTIRQYFVAS